MRIDKFYPYLPLAVLSATLIAGCSSQGLGSLENNQASMKTLTSTSRPEDYRIGADDLLDIKVFQADELSREVRVDAKGNITLPLIGKIPVAGLTQSEAEQRLAEVMQQNLLQNPQVTVFIKQLTSQRVTLEGEFKQPGVYPIAGQVTLLQAIAMAQGPSTLAATDKVVLFRNQGTQNKAYLVDLNAIRDGRMPDPFIHNDDRLVMHRSNSRFWLREAATLLSPLNTLDTIIQRNN